MKINDAFFNLSENYVFSHMNEKVSHYKKNNPMASVISLGIGDVSRPLPKAIVETLTDACLELGIKETFKGYGPETGYSFLIDAIIKNEYQSKNIHFQQDEVFIGDGINSDIVNILDILSKDNQIAIQNPVYPVYVDSSIIKHSLSMDDIYFLDCNKDNDFIPTIPTKKLDVIYLCSPNNPTGATFNRQQLKEWIDYAKENHALILFDGAYCSFIDNDSIPKTIYEIEGSREVAIEFRSFSKTVGFTGVRCSYTIIPHELYGDNHDLQRISLNQLFRRRQSSNYNGVSYISQKGASAYYTAIGFLETQQNILYYKENAKMIRDTLIKLNYQVYGGIHSPYIWFKIKNEISSWDFFDLLLDKAQIIGTPGIGFGKNGEYYFRFSAFASKENTIEAMKRFIDFDQEYMKMG